MALQICYVKLFMSAFNSYKYRMVLHSINDLSNQHVVEMLKNNLSLIKDPTIISNYHPDYTSTPGNLFYILNEGRYQIGNYFVIEEAGEYIASAGWNEYELDNDIALMLTRMYTAPKFRMNYHVGNNILPIALGEVTNYEKIWITCNEHNRAIYDWFSRVEHGRRGGLFNDWPELYRRFKPIGKKNVYYTEQYVAEYKRT
jgi:hypothetical protein